VSGIILNTTGTSGGLTVTGDGNTSVGGDSSGGTIQHTIALTDTTSPSFTNMNIQSTASQRRRRDGRNEFHVQQWHDQ
jgi:hypothetical protein